MSLAPSSSIPTPSHQKYNAPSLTKFHCYSVTQSIIPVYVTHPQVSIAPLSYASNKRQSSQRQHPHRQLHCGRYTEVALNMSYTMLEIQMDRKQSFISNHYLAIQARKAYIEIQLLTYHRGCFQVTWELEGCKKKEIELVLDSSS